MTPRELADEVAFNFWAPMKHQNRIELRDRIEATILAYETDQWRPIAEAPRDGTMILAKGVGDKDWGVICWEPVHSTWACSWDNWPLEEFSATEFRLLPSPPKETP